MEAFKTIVAELLEQKKYSAAIVVHGGTIMSILEALAEEKRHFMTGRLEMRWDIICIYQMRHGKRQRLTVLEKIT